jgi:PilZ domain
MSNERFRVQIPVTFLARSTSSVLLTEYVTYRGVFVSTDSPPAPLELLKLELVLPSPSPKITMHGLVSQLVLAKDALPGVEVTFFAKSGEASGHWDSFIQHVRDAYPESMRRPVLLGQDEARRTPRAPAGSDGRARTAVIGEINGNGMFLKTDESFAVGANLAVVLSDPRSSANVKLECIVLRRALGTGRGLGLQFRNMTNDARAKVKEVIRGAGSKKEVGVQCREMRATPPQDRMNTIPGAGSPRTFASAAPSGGARASLDAEWPAA